MVPDHGKNVDLILHEARNLGIEDEDESEYDQVDD